jgi:hypothetical protein
MFPDDSRPLIQKDSLVHMAQLWRGRYTGNSGELQPDPLSESFRSKDGMDTDHKAYGIWVNTVEVNYIYTHKHTNTHTHTLKLRI